jgi:crotonobetainyl-CoA:carnitine CoA-transferase CaiB-like acyl-CoA transferase
MLVEAEHAQAGPIRMLANPIRLSATPVEHYPAPPLLGEHTHEVLSTLLAMDASHIESLRSRNVL